MNLKEQMEADLDVFTNPDEFGVVAAYNGVEINGQFMEKFDETADTFYKVFWGKYADLSSVSKGDAITINGTTYGVVDFDIDDFKHSVALYLNKEL